MKALAIAFLSIILFASFGCSPVEQPEESPLIPLDWVEEQGGIVPFRATISVEDERYSHLVFNPTGKSDLAEEAATLFPTDVLVVFSDGMDTPLVFLARAPHGGCLVHWAPEGNYFEDPCFGSRFDLNGEYLSGPSPRGLDRLASTVREGFLWVGNEIIYAETVNPGEAD